MGCLGGGQKVYVEKVYVFFRSPILSSETVLLNYAGSGLPQGPSWENNLFPLKVGLRWFFLFFQWAEMGPKEGVSGVQIWVKSGSKPTFSPTLTHFGISAKTHCLASLRGVESVFSKKGPEAVPTQHNFRNSIPPISYSALRGAPSSYVQLS